jgi:hypothetical protein
VDERFPRYIRWIVARLDFIGLPNLGMLICGLAVLAFVGKVFLGAPLEHFIFDPGMVLAGEWWRLLAFPITPRLENPIFFLFFVLYVYYVVGSLEGEWGPGPTTVFILFSYLVAIAGSFITMMPMFIWFYVLENVSLAFGTVFPEMELYFYGLLPVKAKWLALLWGAILLLQFLTGDLFYKLFLLVVMSPYLLFFSPILYGNIRHRMIVARNRRRFDSDDDRR